MGAVFFFLFGAMGALNPFLSLYYQEIGLSATETGLLMAVMPVLLFISQPIFGPLTDRSGHRGKMLARLMLISALAGALLSVGGSFWSMLPMVVLWSFFAGLLVPIGDSVALGESVRTGVAYPRIRLWGSIGFLVMTTALGRVYNVTDLRWAFPAYSLLVLAAGVLAWRLPPDGMAGQRKPVWPQLRQLLGNRYLLALLFVSGLMQVTQAAHTVFFSVHLQQLGGTTGLVGAAWALGAATEVPVWLVLSRWVRRFGALPLMALAGGMFAVRWYLYSVVTAPGLLVGLQLLQAFSFAIFMPTAVVLVGELTPPELRTSGQSLLSIVNGGLATVLGTVVAGRIADLSGTAGLYRVLSYVAIAAGAGFIALALARKYRTNRLPSTQPEG